MQDLLSRIDDFLTEIDAAGGEGYPVIFKKGLSSKENWDETEEDDTDDEGMKKKKAPAKMAKADLGTTISNRSDQPDSGF